MKRISITRNGQGQVEFETVTVDSTENVFFINLDTLEPHWPSIADNQLGPAPSPPSSQCFPEASYTCLIPGHGGESGSIIIVEALTAVNADDTNTVRLANATKGQPITRQQLVTGGASPYKLTDLLFEVLDPNSAVLQSGSGCGPGLELIPMTDNTGVWVSGTPAVPGTYRFTFVVDDGTGSNLQQIQYVMVVD